MFKKILSVIYVLVVAAMGYTQYGMIGMPLGSGMILTPGIAVMATMLFAVFALIIFCAVIWLQALVCLIFDKLN